MGQHRAEDGREQHHDQDAVEHSAVEQWLASRIERLVRDEDGRERRRDLRQRQRPHRSACLWGITESTTTRLRRDPLTDKERTDDPAPDQTRDLQRCTE